MRSSTFFIQSRLRDCSLVSGLILDSRIELITTSSEFLKVVLLLGPLFRITNSQGGALFSYFHVLYGKDGNVIINFLQHKKNSNQKYDDFQDRVPGIVRRLEISSWGVIRK